MYNLQNVFSFGLACPDQIIWISSVVEKIMISYLT